jgi:hypothetical protein
MREEILMEVKVRVTVLWAMTKCIETVGSHPEDDRDIIHCISLEFFDISS